MLKKVPPCFHSNEIRPSKENIEFLHELKDLLWKHKVNIVYGEHHVIFCKHGKTKPFAQTFVC